MNLKWWWWWGALLKTQQMAIKDKGSQRATKKPARFTILSRLQTIVQVATLDMG